jgi:hypothetical protein
LRLSTNGRYLVDASGAAFLVVGDTAWSLIAQLRQDDILRYLEDRQQRGYNGIIVNLIEHKYASRAPANIQGLAPFLKPNDFTQPNPEYFDYAHRAIQAANERGISVWLCPAYLGAGGGDEGFFQEIKAAGPSALRTYGRYLGQHFKDLPNIVWMVGGDNALPEAERWTGNELAIGLREGGADQLMTAHGGQTSALETFGEQPWLEIEAVYRYQSDLWLPLQAAYKLKPVRPFVLIETTYEGEHDAKPDQIRRQAWWAMLCGACGQFFGNNPLWHFDGPTLFPAKGTWQMALDSTGSRDIARLGSFFSSRKWQDLIPDTRDALIKSGAGENAARAVAARGPDGSFAILYIPDNGGGPRELTLNLSSFPSSMKAQWIDPSKDATPIQHPNLLLNQGRQQLRTPGENGGGAGDWVLLLDKP